MVIIFKAQTLGNSVDRKLRLRDSLSGNYDGRILVLPNHQGKKKLIRDKTDILLTVMCRCGNAQYQRQ